MQHVIELFTANHCPSCPDARVRLREFADRHRNVTIVEHNVDEDVRVAAGYGLFATPAIVIDGRSVLYGVPTLAQLARRCGLPEAGTADAVSGAADTIDPAASAP